MNYETYKQILCTETGEIFRIGDTVTIKFINGGGAGGCRITKITDKGFHYNQGSGSDKSVQYEKVLEIHH